MIPALDSSVLIAGLSDQEADHPACAALLRQGHGYVHAHALHEVFATFTGGRLGFRVPPDETVRQIESLLSLVKIVSLSEREVLTALRETGARGVRGGAIYDFMHLVAARKIKATHFYTLDLGDFASFHRPGDPEILRP